jgi:hypothetical protein
VSPLVSGYVLTDQTYVARLVERNLEENANVTAQQKPSTQKRKGKSLSSTTKAANLRFTPLDWELDEVTESLTGSPDVGSFDAIIACDCIYNETLIKPLVQTCADACRLRQRYQGLDGAAAPAICIVAQQLRDPEIFEGWIKEFSSQYRVWRVPEKTVSKELRENTGFVVHIGILKDHSVS